MLGRRSILKGVAATGVANTLSTKAAIPKKNVVAAQTNAVVETTSGKIRGYTANGIYGFKGVPYAAPAGGSRRFMAPEKPEPWTGIRNSLCWGRICPPGNTTLVNGGTNASNNDEDRFMLYRSAGHPGAGEDCLRLNVWTPSLNASSGKKRPVMVWFHGGGWVGGSGNDLASYEGENLSRKGDLVVVTSNHRLNILGYLNLAEAGGEKYRDSGNVGLLDMLAILQWVRDNIANFGGDPGNVTIFGQSGGGQKVSSLLAMPAAKGLIHRAIVQSGPMLQAQKFEDTAAVAAALLKKLNLSSIDEIQNLPLETLYAAQRSLPAASRPGSGPAVDGRILPNHPFDPTAPLVSKDVPLMIGTTLNEFIHGCDDPMVDQMTVEEMTSRMRKKFGDKTEAIVAAYRREYPKGKNFDILSTAFASKFREDSMIVAERKIALKAAPVYQYVYAWHTPMFDGRPRAFHSSEISFVFNNAELCPNYNGLIPEALELASNMSQAWIEFARSGNPNHRGLPYWPAFNADKRPTMFFDTPSTVKFNPEGEGLKLATS